MAKRRKNRKAGKAARKKSKKSVKIPEKKADVSVEIPEVSDSLTKKAEDTQTKDQTGDATVVAIEDTAGAESLKEKTDNIQSGDQVEDLAGAVSENTDDIENLKESAGDIKSDDQTGEIVVVDDTEDPKTSDQADDTTDAVIEGTADTEILTEKADGIQPDDQSGIAADANPENLTEETDDTQGGKSTAGSISTFLESEDDVEGFTEKADDIQADKDTEADSKESAAKGQTAVDRHKMFSLINKTGILITAIMMAVAIILLLLTTFERKSAKEALFKANKAAEAIEHLQKDSLKAREQIIQTQIQGRDLIIDALSLTRNSLELERADTDDTEVKRIIGVFINDIDKRIAKINDENALLRNKLKEAD